jgi:signal peptidase I
MKLLIAVVVFAIAFASGCFILQRGTITFEGFSMLPTIQNGQKLSITRLDLDARNKLVRGDIVAFRYPKDQSKWYIKRVIALPGESVEVLEGKILVNANLLKEPYVDPKLNGSRASYPSIIVPPRSYYVLGDNRDNSSDSRSWGVVPEGLVYAKVIGP